MINEVGELQEEDYTSLDELDFSELTSIQNLPSQDPIRLSLLTPLQKETLANKICEVYKRKTSPIFTDDQAHTALSLSQRRIDFVRELVQRKGYLSHNEILTQMSKTNYLHEYTSSGQKIPITREMVGHMIRKESVFPKSFFNQDPVANRYRYARRYIQLTEDKHADICFLGEFSFSSNSSLSSCPVTKRDSFVNYQTPSLVKKVKLSAKEEAEGDRWGKNIQIMVVISLSRILYFELYSNIFAECHFFKAMMAISKAIKEQNPTQYKKYLILDTNFFHSKQDLRNVEEETNVKMIFLPPQTPMLNPTEYLFNELRQQVKSKQYKHLGSFKATLMAVFQEWGEKSMQSYYSCIRSYLQLSLINKPFK